MLMQMALVGFVIQTTIETKRKITAYRFLKMPIPDTTVITGFVIKAMKRKGAAVLLRS